MKIHQRLQSLLLEAGLSETDNLVYIELLKRPAETPFDLVKRTGLPKTTVYRSIDHLSHLRMVARNQNGILTALSPKNLVAEIQKSRRHLGKIANQLKEISPYLKTPSEEIEVFETYHTPDQIKEIYLFMSELAYSTNLDFGDFENFIPLTGGIEIGNKFRANRSKHATHKAICTTFGKYTKYYTTRKAEKEFKSRVKLLNSNLKNNFITFSDDSDYVLFNNTEDKNNPHATLVKSKTIADFQRKQFDFISRQLGN